MQKIRNWLTVVLIFDLQNELSLVKEDITNLSAELTFQSQQLSEWDFRITENEHKLTNINNTIIELMNEIKKPWTELLGSRSQISDTLRRTEFREFLK